MEQAGLLVLLDRHLPEQLGELASGEPARQVHLEKAILAVDESRRVSEVDAIRGRDSGNTEAIPLDFHRRREARGT